MDMFAILAETKIREAISNGELDDLPGQGQPLKLDDLSMVPEELRAGYIMLKNAGVLPEEIQLQKEIVNLQRLISYSCEDSAATDEIKALEKKLKEKLLRYEMIMEKRKTSSSVMSMYKDKISRKLGRK